MLACALDLAARSLDPRQRVQAARLGGLATGLNGDVVGLACELIGSIPVPELELDARQDVERHVDGGVTVLASALAELFEQRPRLLVEPGVVERPRIPGSRAVVELEPAKLLLEGHGPLEEVGSDAFVAHELEVAEVRERPGERRLVSEALGELDGFSRVLPRRREAFLLGRGERQALEDAGAEQVVVAGLRERAPEVLAADAACPRPRA